MHSKKFTKTERRGLPGGPNEVFTYVTGVFSTEGYKNGSPDINNPFNIIPSGKITMKDVDFPVIGIDNLGNKKKMMPGGEYEFPGDTVFEIPERQEGGEEGKEKESFLDYTKRKLLRGMNPFAKIDDTLQGLGVPANIIREGIEGISGYFGDEGGYGDGEFNFRDIVPDIENTSILDDTKAQRSISNVLEIDGAKGFLVDLLTDPSTYVGAGVAKNIIKKAGSTGIPKLTKSLLPKLKNSGVKSTDDVVDMVEDIFGKKIKKADAERFFRIEDANVNAKTYVDPKTNIRSYESGNWVTNNPDDVLYYTNNTATAGVPRGAGNMLSANDPRRLITGYMDKETAKLFNAPNSTAIARDFSGGAGNPALQREFIIPPNLMDNLRKNAPNDMFRNDIFLAVDKLYKMYGGDLPKAQKGIFTRLIKEGAKKLDDIIPVVQRKLRELEKSTGLYSKDNLLKEVPVPGSDVTIQAPTNLARILDKIGFNKITGRNSYLPSWARRDDGSKVVAQASMPGPYSFDNNGMQLLYNPTGNYYTIPEAFMTNPLTAGKTFKGMENFIPKGGIIKQGPDGSLSTDSFKLMMNRLKRGKFSDVTNYNDPNISRYLNSYGKGTKGTRTTFDKTFDNDNLINSLENQMFNLQRQGRVGEGFTGFGRRNFYDLSGVKVQDISAPNRFEIGVPNLSIRKNYTKGGSVTWMWKGKSYSGTLIPSMENENNRYARTKNGKIKTLPKKKMGGKLRIYKDFVNGVYDNSSNIDFVQSVYDKVNRIYRTQAKEANMSVPNFVMTYLQDS